MCVTDEKTSRFDPRINASEMAIRLMYLSARYTGGSLIVADLLYNGGVFKGTLLEYRAIIHLHIPEGARFIASN